jgi:hypothetical protein
MRLLSPRDRPGQFESCTRECALCNESAVPCATRQVFAGQLVGVRQVSERIWLVTFMHYDLGYFGDETCRLEPIDNPFGPSVLPMSPE